MRDRVRTARLPAHRGDSTGNREEQVDKLFKLAQQDVAGYEAYAKKVRRFFIDSPGYAGARARQPVLHRLGRRHDPRSRARLPQESSATFSASTMRGSSNWPASTCCSTRAPTLISSWAWRRRAERRRGEAGLSPAGGRAPPDRLIAKGVPEELIDVATARMAAINQRLQPDHEARRLTARNLTVTLDWTPPHPHMRPRQLTGWPLRFRGRGKSGLHRNTVTANGRRGRPQGKCHRKQTACASARVRMKGCGKSAPRTWQQGRHGKPHREQDQIGMTR